LNVVANDEHVPEAERLMERTKSIYNTLQFKSISPMLLTEKVYASTFWLICFPHPNGTLDFINPRAIVTGQQIDFNQHCTLELGTYVQVH
jgi:hypothetical protein